MKIKSSLRVCVSWSSPPLSVCFSVSSTTPLANIRITNGYVTVQPPLTQQEQRRRTVGTPWERPAGSAAALAPQNLASRDTGHALTCLITCLVLHMSFTS